MSAIKKALIRKIKAHEKYSKLAPEDQEHIASIMAATIKEERRQAEQKARLFR